MVDMAKKKEKLVISSQEDAAWSREVLAHYHQIAAGLRKSLSRTQAEKVLGEINALPEGAQVALAKALAKEQQTDAADLLAAINELGSQKSARKEARRSLLQLESRRIYPNWKLPAEESAMPVPLTLRRYWKGAYTDTLNSSEINLVLCWEEGTGYKRLLVLGFLLDFTTQGVKDFFTYEERKEDYESIIAHMSAGFPVKSCTLAQGRSLLRRALAINEQYGGKLPADYRRHQSLISQLILAVPGLEDEEVEEGELGAFDEDEDEGEPDLRGLDPQTVVVSFVEYWASGEFDIAYRLLASDSPLREGLTEEEWAQRRDEWAEEFDPGDFQPNFAEEREAPKSRLWLPRGGDRNIKVVEAGWSLELDEGLAEDVIEEEEESWAEFEEEVDGEETEEERAPADTTDITLPELPTASAIYQESGRHWYLASYTLVKDQGEWRIQSITDEAAALRALADEELQAKVEQSNKDIEEYLRKHPILLRGRLSENRAINVLSGMLTMLFRLSYVLDAVIAKDVEVDLSLVQSVASIMSLLKLYERSLFLFDYLAEQSEEMRVANLRAVATMRRLLAGQYEENGYLKRAKRFRELAEQELEELLARAEDAGLHISLAEVLLDSKRLVDAEDHLLRAKELTTDEADLAHIEMHLGEIEMDRGALEEGLAHYRRVTELQPDVAESWADLAQAYVEIDNQQEAEKHFRHAIELDPHDVDIYQEWSSMYQKAGAYDKAASVLEQGQKANPDSVDLVMLLATLYLQIEDMPKFERALNQLARLAPDFPGLSMMRTIVKMMKFAPKGKEGGAAASTPAMPPLILPPGLDRPKKRR
jgi:tetratricopeptide (TPR) repeat protein